MILMAKRGNNNIWVSCSFSDEHFCLSEETNTKWHILYPKTNFLKCVFKNYFHFTHPSNCLSDLPKHYIFETQFIGECRFPMPVLRTLSNSPNDSNSPLTFSSVLYISVTVPLYLMFILYFVPPILIVIIFRQTTLPYATFRQKVFHIPNPLCIGS